ncbi:aldo/keto reductase [Streptomyces pseudovenezuelae]|uniref:aldo/keto reductase n=1 Tax=Streptomyces pseudovenezuelae TaxID=67350 RepID=UPI002E81817A|nr:aldo/keto reductase [Streptomyces pseudovenezuelae]WUA85918.1 aldo/keto reductase [Streptomyces pseudovenezuelae]
MRKRTLGTSAVGAVGLGCMGMSYAYTTGGWNDEVSARVVGTALDLGVTVLDTADVYGPYSNEILLGRALRGRRQEAFLSGKGGLVAGERGGPVPDGRPEHLKAAAKASLRRLGTDRLDLYQLHRLDAKVPLEESWGALAELVGEGLVRNIGLSEVGVGELQRAHAVHPVASVQSELSLWTRDALRDVVPWCAAHGCGFIAYAPLGRGFLTGTQHSRRDFADNDRRLRLPRFTEAAMREELRALEPLKRVAERHGVTPGQVALGWVLAQGDHIVPIAGTRRPAHLVENAAAADVALTPADIAELDAIPQPSAPRY